MIDHYKILSVDHLATENHIKKRFRILAKLYHPDRNNGSRESEERFKEVLNAYEILSDKSKRYHYYLEYSLLNIDSSEVIHDSNKNVYRNTSNIKDQKDWVRKDRKYTYYFIIILFIIFLWLITKNSNNSSTTGNSKADKELEQLPSERPETGDIDFNDK
jgi:curved DNA-binding protein CbpA